MKVSGEAAARKALVRLDPAIRLILLHGADAAGSDALCGEIARVMGPDAERIDIEAGALNDDPALLLGESASIGMFGGKRWIRVRGAGDPALAAVERLLGAEADGDLAVVVAAKLAKNSKLLTLCEGHARALAIESVPAVGRNAEQIAVDHAREQGLSLPAELARRLVALCHGERGLLLSEIDKLALYLDASPQTPATVTADAMDALAAEGGEDALYKSAAVILSGRADAASHEIARAREGGASLAGLVRLTLMQAVSLDQARHGLGRRNDGPVNWSPAALGRAIHRLAEAERASRTDRAVAEAVMAQALIGVCQLAARQR
ncbi:DNA polymerase III subunit delta [Sphingobium sp. CR28]|uniref:DNA polymerase III subunit delta n=1 Tax=Sphingobium sp. CR28 TaxID=3400272 RepID=UPI003FEEE020